MSLAERLGFHQRSASALPNRSIQELNRPKNVTPHYRAMACAIHAALMSLCAVFPLTAISGNPVRSYSHEVLNRRARPPGAANKGEAVRLSGNSVIVTGGAGGLGEATCR